MALRIGRRFFLRSAGGAALGIPFLPSLMPRDAVAGGNGGPRRFIAMQSQSGQMVADYWPTATPAGYQTRDAMYGGPRADGTTALHENIPGTNFKRAPLADFAGQPLSPVLSSELEPFFDKMMLVRGLDYLAGTSHGSGQMLGNYANCASGGEFSSRGLGWMPTIDQVLAYSDAFYPEVPKARSIQLATGSPNSMSDTDYGMKGGAVETLSGYLEPLYLWQDLFSDFVAPEKMPTEHPNLKLVDSVYEDFARLRSNARMSADDRASLERHMAFLDDLERELEGGFAAGCSSPDEPPFFDMGYPWQEVSSVEDFQHVAELLVDIAVAAVRCDMTRIVTFNVKMAITNALGALATSFHQSDDVAGDWHDFAHDAVEDGNDHAHIVSLNRWIGETVFRRFLEGLDVEESLGETYLDNSLVYWGSELSMDHYVLGMPTVLAGGAAGQLQTGYYLDYTKLDGDYANPILPWGVLIPGVPHNRLLVTILQAMGLSPADYEQGGRPGYGHTEMFFGPYNMPQSVYAFGDIDKPLPGLFAG